MNFDLFIDISKVAHGLFNIFVFTVLLYQSWIGLKIRKGRETGQSQFAAVKKHRKLGPILVFTGLLGYCFGLILVFIDKGQVLEYPLHLALGTLVMFFLAGQYVVSRRIKGRESSWRMPHLAIGIGILCLYVLQIITGMSVLF